MALSHKTAPPQLALKSSSYDLFFWLIGYNSGIQFHIHYSVRSCSKLFGLYRLWENMTHIKCKRAGWWSLVLIVIARHIVKRSALTSAAEKNKPYHECCHFYSRIYAFQINAWHLKVKSVRTHSSYCTSTPHSGHFCHAALKIHPPTS